jgi:hypothetical protein
MSGIRPLVSVIVALLATALSGAPVHAAELSIDVRPDGTARVDGQSESLRTVLEELCTRAGVTLRYDAPDEPVAVAMPEGAEPLDKVVERLLRGKSYTTRFASRPGEPVRLASLHVVGPGNGVVVSAPPDRNVVAPAQLLEAVFGRNSGGADREAALVRLMDTVRNDPQRLNNFLNGDLAPMQKALARYPQAPSVLRAVLERPEVDGVVRARIQALLAGLD